MSAYREWDFDNPAHRRRPRIETVEILPPRQPDRTVRVDVVHHHRSNQLPPWLPFAVLGFLIAFRFLPFIGIGLIVIIALAFAYPAVGIIFALWLAASIGIIIFCRRSARLPAARR
jgi:hypothetical protein